MKYQILFVTRDKGIEIKICKMYKNEYEKYQLWK